MIGKKFMVLFLSLTALTQTVWGQSQPPAPQGKVLVVLSGVNYVSLKGGRRHPTGFFLSELMVPAGRLIQAGYQLVFADPTGQTPAMDVVSDDPKWFSSPQEYQAMKKGLISLVGLRQPRTLASFTEAELNSFDGVFLPGGHAPMEDLYRDRNLGRILIHFHQAGLPTGLICHAPIALLSAGYVSQPWIYRGYKLTVFSTAEEKQEETSGALNGLLNYYVADALAKAGAQVHANQPWTSDVIQDRELITGQNPMSAEVFGEALVRALSRVSAGRALERVTGSGIRH